MESGKDNTLPSFPPNLSIPPPPVPSPVWPPFPVFMMRHPYPVQQELQFTPCSTVSAASAMWYSRSDTNSNSQMFQMSGGYPSHMMASMVQPHFPQRPAGAVEPNVQGDGTMVHFDKSVPLHSGRSKSTFPKADTCAHEPHPESFQTGLSSYDNYAAVEGVVRGNPQAHCSNRAMVQRKESVSLHTVQSNKIACMPDWRHGRAHDPSDQTFRVGSGTDEEYAVVKNLSGGVEGNRQAHCVDGSMVRHTDNVCVPTGQSNKIVCMPDGRRTCAPYPSDQTFPIGSSTYHEYAAVEHPSPPVEPHHAHHTGIRVQHNTVPQRTGHFQGLTGIHFNSRSTQFHRGLDEEDPIQQPGKKRPVSGSDSDDVDVEVVSQPRKLQSICCYDEAPAAPVSTADKKRRNPALTMPEESSDEDNTMSDRQYGRWKLRASKSRKSSNFGRSSVNEEQEIEQGPPASRMKGGMTRKESQAKSQKKQTEVKFFVPKRTRK